MASGDLACEWCRASETERLNVDGGHRRWRPPPPHSGPFSNMGSGGWFIGLEEKAESPISTRW